MACSKCARGTYSVSGKVTIFCIGAFCFLGFRGGQDNFNAHSVLLARALEHQVFLLPLWILRNGIWFSVMHPVRGGNVFSRLGKEREKHMHFMQKGIDTVPWNVPLLPTSLTLPFLSPFLYKPTKNRPTL